MRKFFCLYYVILFGSGMVVHSQENWTAEDSLWIQRIRNGTEIIRLNEATRKAIESGTLIRDPFTTKPMIANPSEMPIIKSLEGVTAPENKPNPYEIPLAVYKIYIQNIDMKDSFPVFRQEAISFGSLAELKALDMLTPRKATVDDPTTLRSGSIVGGGADFDGFLRNIFWPSHRAKKRNAKNANAWKTYNEH